MNKLYNKQINITSEFSQFFEKYIPSLRKTQLNFMPSILYGMINSKSLVAKDIALELNDELRFAKLDSVIKRINRFLVILILYPMIFGMILSRLSLIIINVNTPTKKYILLLITCSLLKITLSL